jgi:hypothetical protein
VQQAQQLLEEDRKAGAVRGVGHGYGGGKMASLRQRAANGMALKAEAAAEEQDKEKVIVKEGLSEYFIFTIEGTETIPNGWAKRLRAIETDSAGIKIQYRYRPREYGDQLVRMYLLTNNKESKLGQSPLPDGTVRVFRENGRDGLSYLAEVPTKYIPIGEKIELNLGTDPEVVFELIKLRSLRENIWMQLNGADVFRRVDDGAAKININSSVVGWDDHENFTQRIRNYTPRDIEVEIERPYDGHVIFRSALGAKLFDYRTAKFTTNVKAGEKKEHLFEVITKQGTNSKQNNVTIEEAK